MMTGANIPAQHSYPVDNNNNQQSSGMEKVNQFVGKETEKKPDSHDIK